MDVEPEGGASMRVWLALAVGICLCWPLAARGTGAAGAQAEQAEAAQAGIAPAPQVEALGGILIERESGRVLWAQDPDRMLPMASTTKVMTALLTLENCSLDEVVTASARASGVPGTSLYLGVGEQLTVEQMLLGLMLHSGNDAAVALAEHISGTVEDFALLMNRRAAELGAQAHFVTPNGLDAEGHVASARAMALIANEAMDFPAFRRLVATQQATLPWRDSPYNRVLTNKNKLLSTYPGTTGVKTGFTQKAGRCLIFSAQREDMELLGVLLNCGGWFQDAAALMDWGFGNYAMENFLCAGQRTGQVPVTGGMEGAVWAVAPTRLRAPVGAGEQAELIVETQTNLTAPVAAGLPVGRAQVIVEGQVVAQRVLVAEKAIPQRTFGAALESVIRHFNPAA